MPSIIAAPDALAPLEIAFLAGVAFAEPSVRALLVSLERDSARWRRCRQIKAINTDKLRPTDWDAMVDKLLWRDQKDPADPCKGDCKATGRCPFDPVCNE